MIHTSFSTMSEAIMRGWFSFAPSSACSMLTQFVFNLVKGMFDFFLPLLQFFLRFLKMIFNFLIFPVEGDGIDGIWPAHCALTICLDMPKFLNSTLNRPLMRQDVNTVEDHLHRKGTDRLTGKVILALSISTGDPQEPSRVQTFCF